MSLIISSDWSLEMLDISDALVTYDSDSEHNYCTMPGGDIFPIGWLFEECRP